jgi:hypothetical protein
MSAGVLFRRLTGFPAEGCVRLPASLQRAVLEESLLHEAGTWKERFARVTELLTD